MRRDKVEDYAARSIGLLGISVPNFFVATLILIFLSRVFHWIPPLSHVPFTQNPAQNLEQFIFPAIAISFFTMAVVMRLPRATMLEVLGLDYVRTARAKGVPRRRVIRKHALRNALIPVATVVAYEVGVLIGASAVVEVIFNLPGLGYTLLQSLQYRGLPDPAVDRAPDRGRVPRLQPGGRHPLRRPRPEDRGRMTSATAAWDAVPQRRRLTLPAKWRNPIGTSGR